MSYKQKIETFAATQTRPFGTSKTNPEEWLKAWVEAADFAGLPSKMPNWELLAMQQYWYQALPNR